LCFIPSSLRSTSTQKVGFLPTTLDKLPSPEDVNLQLSSSTLTRQLQPFDNHTQTPIAHLPPRPSVQYPSCSSNVLHQAKPHCWVSFRHRRITVACAWCFHDRSSSIVLPFRRRRYGTVRDSTITRRPLLSSLLPRAQTLLCFRPIPAPPRPPLPLLLFFQTTNRESDPDDFCPNLTSETPLPHPYFSKPWVSTRTLLKPRTTTATTIAITSYHRPRLSPTTTSLPAGLFYIIYHLLYSPSLLSCGT
jgi:hypothetical protein